MSKGWTEIPFEGGRGGESPPPLPPGPAKVFVALPSYNGFHKSQSLHGLLLATGKAHIHYELGIGSLLATNFNSLLCKARNSRHECAWTHFAMMHADISAPELWLDAMVEEMARVGADVLSVVVPIKDDRRLTSTGAVQGDGTIRRLTMREVWRLPETFSAGDLPAVGINAPLVINTGLFLCRFDRPWSDEFHFSIGDGIRKEADGFWRPLVLPEDWGWSHWCNQKGLRVFATRKVRVTHWDGGSGWDNGDPAGAGWEYDLGDDEAKRDEVRKVREAEKAALLGVPS